MDEGKEPGGSGPDLNRGMERAKLYALKAREIFVILRAFFIKAADFAKLHQKKIIAAAILLFALTILDWSRTEKRPGGELGDNQPAEELFGNVQEAGDGGNVEETEEIILPDANGNIDDSVGASLKYSDAEDGIVEEELGDSVLAVEENAGLDNFENIYDESEDW